MRFQVRTLFRICAFAALCALPPIRQLPAQEKSATDVPPWKRMLKDVDEKKSNELQSLAEKLQKKGKYREAMTPLREAIALRTKLQGAKHWQTIDARFELAAMQRLASLSPEKRGQLDRANQVATRANRFQGSGNPKAAEPLWRQALKVFREVLGSDHPSTMTAESNMAVAIEDQGRHAEADAMLRAQLLLRTKLFGEEHPATVDSLHNVAQNLTEAGQDAESEPLLRRSLELSQRIFGPDDQETMQFHMSLAGCLLRLRQFDEAAEMNRRVVEIAEKTPKLPSSVLAIIYMSAAHGFHTQGKVEQAEKYYQKALKLERDGGAITFPTPGMSGQLRGILAATRPPGRSRAVNSSRAQDPPKVARGQPSGGIRNLHRISANSLRPSEIC